MQFVLKCSLGQGQEDARADQRASE